MNEREKEYLKEPSSIVSTQLNRNDVVLHNDRFYCVTNLLQREPVRPTCIFVVAFPVKSLICPEVNTDLRRGEMFIPVLLKYSVSETVNTYYL